MLIALHGPRSFGKSTVLRRLARRRLTSAMWRSAKGFWARCPSVHRSGVDRTAALDDDLASLSQGEIAGLHEDLLEALWGGSSNRYAVVTREGGPLATVL